MNVRFILTSLLVSAIMFLPRFAAASDFQLDLRGAIEQVLENNPNFRVYRLRREALAGELQNADLNPAWHFNVELENFLGSGDLRDFKGSEWTMTLSRVVERGNKRQARTGVIRQRQALIDAEQQILELNLLSETASRFIDVASEQARLEILQRSVQLASSVLDEVNNRINAGRSHVAERSRAAASLAEAELAVESAEYAKASARFRLASLWGSAEPVFSEVSANLLQVESVGNVRDLIDALEESPAIAVFTSETRLREAEVSLARAQQIADFSIGGGIKHVAEINDTAFVAEFSVPLQSKQRARGAVTTAQANLLRVDSEEAVALQKMRGRLLALDQQRQSAVNRFVALQSSIIPQLEQAFEQTRQAYDSGLYNYLELGAAQRELLNAELERVAAAAQAHQLRIEIERLSGQNYQVVSRATGGNQ
ncbi:MAG: TolC family protein [Pseudomonadales bacterium]|nr:TolC family protein [Pseudomonadales bacterium]